MVEDLCLWEESLSIIVYTVYTVGGFAGLIYFKGIKRLVSG
jgi:hypothetical protein